MGQAGPSAADVVNHADRATLTRIFGLLGEERLAPRWDVHKNAVRDLLAAELERRGTRQGSAHGV